MAIETNNVAQILTEIDREIIKTLCPYEQRDWGFLSWNKGNPTQYYTNHAQIIEPCSDVEVVIEEVIEFYQGQGLTPRFYVYEIERHGELLNALREHGFSFDKEGDTKYMRWNGETFADAVLEQPTSAVVIERVNDDNAEAAFTVLSGVSEFQQGEFMRLAFEAERKNPLYYHFVLFENGQPAAFSQFMISGDYVMIEGVSTLPAFRGKGYAGHLIARIQREFQLLGKKQLGLIPANEQVEKLYKRYGFETLGATKFVMAFLEQQSE